MPRDLLKQASRGPTKRGVTLSPLASATCQNMPRRKSTPRAHHEHITRNRFNVLCVTCFQAATLPRVKRTSLTRRVCVTQNFMMRSSPAAGVCRFRAVVVLTLVANLPRRKNARVKSSNPRFAAGGPTFDCARKARSVENLNVLRSCFGRASTRALAACTPSATPMSDP